MRKKHRKLVRKAYNHSDKVLTRLEQLRRAGYDVDTLHASSVLINLALLEWMRHPPDPVEKTVL